MTLESFLQGARACGDKMPVSPAGGPALADKFNRHSCTKKILSLVLLVWGHLLVHIILGGGQRRNNLLMSRRMNLVRKGSVPTL